MKEIADGYATQIKSITTRLGQADSTDKSLLYSSLGDIGLTIQYEALNGNLTANEAENLEALRRLALQ